MKQKFEQFIRERKYLSNVTPATLEWYGVDVIDSECHRKNSEWYGDLSPSICAMSVTIDHASLQGNRIQRFQKPALSVPREHAVRTHQSFFDSLLTDCG